MSGKRGRATRATQIIHQQEQLALNLLNRANVDKAEITLMLDAFDRITKWVAVRNRVEDEGESRIDEFKRRIAGEGDKHYPPSRRPAGWTPPATATPRLDALKSRLSAGNGRNPDGDGGDSGGEDPAPVEH